MDQLFADVQDETLHGKRVSPSFGPTRGSDRAGGPDRAYYTFGMARIQVGDQAPDFTLPSQTGQPVRLRDRLGERVVVLYFYPKDDTPGCTAEACA
jgi:hypothetical protein